ncbi:MAG: bacterioferritin-associated ferredoxin [Acidimicrobiales bacterium]|nr:(2Fe-2S)-binding protein [Actinomycetota bacterium]
MFICHCRKVTDRHVCAAIEAGACDPDSLATRCGAGTGCGGCVPALRALLACYGLVHEVSA